MTLHWAWIGSVRGTARQAPIARTRASRNFTYIFQTGFSSDLWMLLQDVFSSLWMPDSWRLGFKRAVPAASLITTARSCGKVKNQEGAALIAMVQSMWEPQEVGKCWRSRGYSCYSLQRIYLPLDVFIVEVIGLILNCQLMESLKQINYFCKNIVRIGWVYNTVHMLITFQIIFLIIISIKRLWWSFKAMLSGPIDEDLQWKWSDFLDIGGWTFHTRAMTCFLHLKQTVLQ